MLLHIFWRSIYIERDGPKLKKIIGRETYADWMFSGKFDAFKGA